MRFLFLVLLFIPTFVLTLIRNRSKDKHLLIFRKKLKLWDIQKSKFLPINKLSELEIGKVVLYRYGAKVPADTLIINSSDLVNKREIVKVNERNFSHNNKVINKL